MTLLNKLNLVNLKLLIERVSIMATSISSGKLVNTDAALTYMLGDADGFRDFLKSNGLSAGKKPVADLFAGARDEVAGFYFVADDVSDLVVDEVVVEVVELAPPPVEADPVVAPTAGAADEKPAFSDDAVAAAVAAALASGAVVVTEKPAEPAAAPAAKKSAAVKVLKAVAPAGKVKPVRRGTKIANGLELLLAGCPASALVPACSDDLVDFCNRRVTKRGYGIMLIAGENGAEDVIKLVLPAGVTSVAFSG